MISAADRMMTCHSTRVVYNKSVLYHIPIEEQNFDLQETSEFIDFVECFPQADGNDKSQFSIVVLSATEFAIKRGDYFAAAEPSCSELNFNRTHIGEWERFRLYSKDGRIKILSREDPSRTEVARYLLAIKYDIDWLHVFSSDAAYLKAKAFDNHASFPNALEIEDAAFISDPGVMGCFRNNNFVAFYESSSYDGREMELRRLTFEAQHPYQSRLTRLTKAAPFCCEWCDNFWHWSTEFLPYAVNLFRRGFDGIFLVSSKSSFARSSLEFYGVPPGRIREVVEDIVLIDVMIVVKRRPGKLPIAHPLIHRALRTNNAVGKGYRIYIGRRDSRKIVNEDELLEILRRFDFIHVLMEDLSFSQQVELASGADFICGPHGAGMTAAMFMREGGCLLEFFAPSYINPCMLSICEMYNINYAMAVSRVYQGQPYGNGLDVYVDADIVQGLIHSLLQAQLGSRSITV